MKVKFGKMFAIILAAVNIAALSSGLPTASAETADDACVCELPPISQE